MKDMKNEMKIDDHDLIGRYTWHEAKKQIAFLNSINYKGYNDWRLPTKEELNALFQNKDTIGDFSSSYYWSSTEDINNFAWGQNFFTGTQSTSFKLTSYRVRCVRGINK